jgi:hypothetical protein
MKDPPKGFREHVQRVQGTRDVKEDYATCIDPTQESKILHVNVLATFCGFCRVCHNDGGNVVNIKPIGAELLEAQGIEYGPQVAGGLSSVHADDKFGLRRAGTYDNRPLRAVVDGGARETEYLGAEGSTGCGAIGVGGVDVGLELADTLWIGNLQVAGIKCATLERDMRKILPRQRMPENNAIFLHLMQVVIHSLDGGIVTGTRSAGEL